MRGSNKDACAPADNVGHHPASRMCLTPDVLCPLSPDIFTFYSHLEVRFNP